MTSPDVGVSGVSAGAVTGPVIPDFRLMLLPGAPKPRRVARDQNMDNLFRKIRNNDAKPHIHAPRILYYRRHVLREPIDRVLIFPYALIQWMRSMEPAPDGDLARAFDHETRRECMLNLAQLAVVHDDMSAASVAKYFEASAMYRASLDSMDAEVLQHARRRRVA